MIVERKIKRGTKNEVRDVKLVQELLGLHVDGDYGPKSEARVKEWQKEMYMEQTGIVGQREWLVLLEDFDTLGLRHDPSVMWAYDSIIHGDWDTKKNPPVRQAATTKDMVMIHHTVSGANPFNVSSYFSTKTFATHFVIGGDGTIVQTCPLGWFCYHINIREDRTRDKRCNVSLAHETRMAQRCIGIELCSWGALDEKDGKLYNAGKREVDKANAIYYAQPYRDNHWYERYSDAQVNALRVLLKALKKAGMLTIDDVPYDRTWCEVSADAINGKRSLTTHVQMRTTKSDIHPQEEMMKMLAGLR